MNSFNVFVRDEPPVFFAYINYLDYLLTRFTLSAKPWLSLLNTTSENVKAIPGFSDVNVSPRAEIEFIISAGDLVGMSLVPTERLLLLDVYLALA